MCCGSRRDAKLIYVIPLAVVVVALRTPSLSTKKIISR